MSKSDSKKAETDQNLAKIKDQAIKIAQFEKEVVTIKKTEKQNECKIVDLKKKIGDLETQSSNLNEEFKKLTDTKSLEFAQNGSKLKYL